MQLIVGRNKVCFLAFATETAEEVQRDAKSDLQFFPEVASRSTSLDVGYRRRADKAQQLKCDNGQHPTKK